MCPTKAYFCSLNPASLPLCSSYEYRAWRYRGVVCFLLGSSLKKKKTSVRLLADKSLSKETIDTGLIALVGFRFPLRVCGSAIDIEFRNRNGAGYTLHKALQ